MSDLHLEVNTIFGALARPAMFAGVTFDYYVINLMVSVVSFILLGSLFYGLIFFPLHLFGVLVCRYDNQFFSVANKSFFMVAMPNKSLWGVRVYEPY